MASKPITPEQLAQNNTEDGHQLALFCWISLLNNGGYPELIAYPELNRLFHIPNGGSRHKAEAAKLKGMGVKAGVPDLLLPVKRGIYSGLFVELKKLKTVLKSNRESREKFTSNEQDDWITYLKSQGFGACVCHGWEAARDTLIKYIEWGK